MNPTSSDSTGPSPHSLIGSNKSHAVGAGVGAVGGAIAGAVIGTTAGPVERPSERRLRHSRRVYRQGRCREREPGTRQ